MKKSTPQWEAMRPCTLAEYDEVAAFADAAFQKEGHNWFKRYRPQIFQATEESARCHRIVRDAGKIAGCIGIYPQTLRVGHAKLTVGGIGTVSTRADLRGGGLMSHMLKDTIRALENGGYDISWLGGARFRYGNYGWEHGGRGVELSVAVHNIPRYLREVPKVSLHTPKTADVEQLQKLYRTLGAGMLRSRDMWSILLRHGEYRWEMAVHQEKAAYAVCSRNNPERIVEVAGAPDIVAALLCAHGRRHQKGWLRIEMPEATSPLLHRLFRISESFMLHHNSQYRIVDAASTWRKLVPEMALRGMAAGVTRASSQLCAVRAERDRAAILHRALGFLDATPPLPGRLEQFEWVRPLGWWFSHVDAV